MRPADRFIAAALADFHAEADLFDPDRAIGALCRRLSALPEAEREAALRALVTGALESFVSRCGAATLAEAGSRARAMLGAPGAAAVKPGRPPLGVPAKRGRAT